MASKDQWGQNAEKNPVMTGIKALAILVIVSMALDWAVQGQNFFLYKFWTPKQEAVRREVYEQTKSYKQGSVQRLGILCTQIADADSAHKPMINAIVVQEFAEWDASAVPEHLRACLVSARAR